MPVIRATGAPQTRSTIYRRECAGCPVDLAGACLLVGSARLPPAARTPATEPNHQAWGRTARAAAAAPFPRTRRSAVPAVTHPG